MPCNFSRRVCIRNFVLFLKLAIVTRLGRPRIRAIYPVNPGQTSRVKSYHVSVPQNRTSPRYDESSMVPQTFLRMATYSIKTRYQCHRNQAGHLLHKSKLTTALPAARQKAFSVLLPLILARLPSKFQLKYMQRLSSTRYCHPALLLYLVCGPCLPNGRQGKNKKLTSKTSPDHHHYTEAPPYCNQIIKVQLKKIHTHKNSSTHPTI